MLLFFFFKQKTAYEMRISDWSSDVCSSDLDRLGRRADGVELRAAIDDEEVEAARSEHHHARIDRERHALAAHRSAVAADIGAHIYAADPRLDRAGPLGDVVIVVVAAVVRSFADRLCTLLYSLHYFAFLFPSSSL